MNEAWLYTLIPAAAAVIGAAAAAMVRPRETIVSAIQHFAAGVVFAAAAAEILPDVMRRGSLTATLVGGGTGIAVMLFVRYVGTRAKGSTALLAMIGVDILIDGLVLGIGFAAGARTGLLLTLALTIEILFLGLTVATELAGAKSKAATVAITAALAVLLPLGALLAAPIATMPSVIVDAFFAFGLVALLYLVTEELLVEAHATPDRPWVTATFFVGFLTIVALEESVR